MVACAVYINVFKAGGFANALNPKPEQPSKIINSIQC